jgi:tRNA threonylcarbamoyl adenosine modification protein YjeE
MHAAVLTEIEASAMSSNRVTRTLPDEGATAALGRELSLFLRAGDCICLYGELGTGKTALARALINSLAPEGEAVEVPSPTFTLIQTYESTRIPVAHFDFYRLHDPLEAVETGFDDLRQSHLTLVEWPERLGGGLPPDRLDIRLDISGPGRLAHLRGHGHWEARLERFEAAKRFLDSGQAAGWRRLHLNGDASIRRYERLLGPDGRTFVLMDMPARPDGPPVRAGRSYSAIAHLAEDCRAVVAINGAVNAAGFSAPEIYSADMARGFLLIEDFGDMLFGHMMAHNEDMSEPLLVAVLSLAEIAGREWPRRVLLPDGTAYELASYDDQALEIEVSLLIDWFWPLVRKAPAPDPVRTSFEAAWRGVFALTRADRPVWVLRDYHSPNLMWLPEREGIRRVGLIDTQDCVLGHPAYDLAALLQDARVDIPRDVATELFDYYCTMREAEDATFERDAFAAAYAVLGAQRASKILGIFARLSRRDGKHGYLRHLERVSNTLEANLAHPALAPVRGWFDRHLPLEARREAAVLTARVA